MSTIVRWALTALLVAGVIFAIVRGYEWWRDGVRDEGATAGRAEVQEKWDADVRTRDAQKLAAIAKARKEEQDQAAAAVKGEHDARIKAERQAAADRTAAARAERAAGGLHGTIAALDGAARDLGIPDAATCPRLFGEQRDAAVRARAVLAACSAAYRELGTAVDDAWRAITLKLDTALGYIHAVKPH